MRLSPWNGSGQCVVFLTLVVSVGAVGCNASTGNISGKVYYKNTPLKGGTVTFVSSDKKASMVADIQEDGSYRIDKMPVGEALISVETSSFKPPISNIPSYAPPKGAQSPDGPAAYKPPDFAARAKRYVHIPERYADADKSGLKHMVKGGSQEQDIKLE